MRRNLAVILAVMLVVSSPPWSMVQGATVPPGFAPGTTTRVSVDSAGMPVGAASAYAISADGRYVVFANTTSNVVTGVSGLQVYRHDRGTGMTELVSVDRDGHGTAAGAFGPAISATGRYVVYVSSDANIVAGDTNGTLDVFVRDMTAGATSVASSSVTGEIGDRGGSLSARIGANLISDDGRYVVLGSTSTNLMPGPINSLGQVYRKDLVSGEVIRVSLDDAGNPGDGASGNAVISGNGRVIAFVSQASNFSPLVTNHSSQVYAHDLDTGLTTIEAVASDGLPAPLFASTSPALSLDGRYLAFETQARMEARDLDSFTWDVYLRDRTAATTNLASLSANTFTFADSHGPMISSDGRYVGFHSIDSMLVPSDVNSLTDVFLYDRDTEAITLVSLNDAGEQIAGGTANFPSLSADGNLVLFQSSATNLVTNPSSTGTQLYVRAFTTSAPNVAPQLEKVNTTGDSFYNDTFVPGRDVTLSLTFSAPMSSADFSVDGSFVRSVLNESRFTWSAPDAYTSHTLTVSGTTSSGARASAQLVLYALVTSDTGVATFLPGGAVFANPFSTDPMTIQSSGDPSPVPASWPAPGETSGFRQLDRIVVEGKSRGSDFVGPPRVTPDQRAGKSFWCDSPRVAAVNGPGSFVQTPVLAADGLSYRVTARQQTRVNVTVPDVITVNPPGYSATLGQNPYIPWIYSTVTEPVSPNGTRQTEWRRPDDVSLFPYHYLYRDAERVGGDADHPPVDVVAWGETADRKALDLIEPAVNAMPLPRRLLWELALKKYASIAADQLAQQIWFHGLLARCAHDRMERVNPTDHHFLDASWAFFYPLAQLMPTFWVLDIYKPELLPHMNPHEWSQGVSQEGFARDPRCLVPGCPLFPRIKLISIFSPLDAHVYDSAGKHTGPLPDGTIEEGVASATYLVIGDDKFLIMPDDPSFRVELRGTGTGLATLNVGDFAQGEKKHYEQYFAFDVSARSVGTLQLGAPGARFTYDVGGTGSPVLMRPQTASSSSAPATSDTVPPVTTVASVGGTTGEPGFFRSPAVIHLTAVDDLAGVDRSEYSLDGASWRTYDAPITVGQEGAHELLYRSVDFQGNAEVARSLGLVIDLSRPEIECARPDGAWHAADVTLACTARDAVSGLADPTQARFALATSVPAGAETADASTDSRTVCDRAGNCAAAGPIAGNMVDRRPPTIVISAPRAGAMFLLNERAMADYTCADGGSGVALCSGTVPNGGPVDTGSIGTKAFAVSGADGVGNTSAAMTTYQVAFNICSLMQARPEYLAGSTIQIKLELCDADGRNHSAPTTAVTARTIVSTGLSRIAQDAGRANPDNAFRFDPDLAVGGGYVYNLSSAGLPPGTYELSFSAAGDPTVHTLTLVLR